MKHNSNSTSLAQEFLYTHLAEHRYKRYPKPDSLTDLRHRFRAKFEISIQIEFGPKSKPTNIIQNSLTRSNPKSESDLFHFLVLYHIRIIQHRISFRFRFRFVLAESDSDLTKSKQYATCLHP